MLGKGKGKDLQEVFLLSAVVPVPCVPPPRFIPNSRELSMLAQSCKSLEVSILWPEPLPHPGLDSDVAPDCTTPSLSLRSRLR